MANKTKGMPPTNSSNNLKKPSSDDSVPMSFRVDREFAKDFKLYATMHDMKYVELLKAAFKQFKGE